MINPLFSVTLTDAQIAKIAGVSPERLEELKELQAHLEQARREAERLLTPTGVWYHVSPHELAAGTVLVPGGPDGTHTSEEFYSSTGLGSDTGTLADMGAARTEFVWLSPHRDDAEFWAEVLDAAHLYEVEPATDPVPWNGTAADGWVTTAATVVRRLEKP